MKQFLLDKVILLNGSVLALSFLEIEAILKLILLIFSIGYTIIKMIKGAEGSPQINSWITNFFNSYVSKFNKKDKMDDK